MPDQFKCRFCHKSYTEILEFLDHFETHMNQDQENESKSKEMQPGATYKEGQGGHSGLSLH